MDFAPHMLPSAAALLAIALFAPLFGLGVADGVAGLLQVAIAGILGAGLASLLLRLARS